MLKYIFTIFFCFMLAHANPDTHSHLPRFSDGFEDAETFADLFPRDISRWTNFNTTFEANTIELSQERAHSGIQSLKCYAIPTNGVTASKSLISCGIFKFSEGDYAWFEMWYYIESSGIGNTPNLFIWDFEAPCTCTQLETCPENGDGSICSSPGRRLYLQNTEGTPIRSDLDKWCFGNDFTQPIGRELPFPTN